MFFCIFLSPDLQPRYVVVLWLPEVPVVNLLRDDRRDVLLTALAAKLENGKFAVFQTINN